MAGAVTLLEELARAKITFQARTLRTILTEGIDMTDKPNSSDFSVNAKPREYKVTIGISGSMSVTIQADSEEHAERLAEDLADKLAEGVLDVELDDLGDVAVDDIRKTPPMYRVTRDGQKMQVSRLLSSDLPRDPDERGF